MRYANRTLKYMLLLAGLAVWLIASADSTVEQLQDQDPNPNNKPTSPDVLTVEPDSQLTALLKEFEYLDRHFRLMAQPNSDDDVARSLKRLKGQSGTVGDVAELYSTLSKMGNADNAYFGEARWRALHLLGELEDPGSAGRFFDIAASPLPDSRESSEIHYKVEYRLRARAVAGLENLEDVDALKKLYGQQGVVRGLAAASLFELGEPPDGITKVDGRKAIGYGDPRDFNLSRTVNPQGSSPLVEIPGRSKEQERVEPSAPTEQ